MVVCRRLWRLKLHWLLGFFGRLRRDVLYTVPMSRVLLTAFGALVCGAFCWGVLGTIAATVFSRMPGGAREGAGAMGGFFQVGGLCGFAGMILGGWLLWRILENPQRAGAVGLSLAAMVVILVVGATIVLQPKTVVRDDYPGRKAGLEVEVSFPAGAMDTLGKTDRLEFQFRSADGTETAAWKREQIRQEDGHAVVPAAFAIHAYPRSKLLAVMKNDQQLMCSTLTVEGDLESSTEWSAWQPMEEGFQARWRLVVTPQQQP